ncbi:MAG: IclR family transcriptional regulator [Hyphomonadaceae bacterium]
MDTTIVKGMRVLEALARAGGPVRLSDLSNQLALQKSNLHRLLRTLLALGYVEQEESSGRYSATLKIWELGVGVLAVHPVRRAAAPILHQLHGTTGETVNLTILAGDDIIYLDKLHSPRPMRFLTEPGSRSPAALTAAGRAILAYHESAPEIIARTVKLYPGDRKISVRAIANELSETRSRGYAISESTRTPGIMGIAGPGLDRSGHAFASISITGPKTRLSGVKQDKIVESLLNACAALSEPVFANH